MKYDYLRKQYPEFVSINQFYKICHVAKRTALYLLEQGIVPYIDTGKKTWKYKIALNDIITYLELRDKKGSQIPRGAVNNKREYIKSEKKASCFSLLVPTEERPLLRKYFKYILADFSDVITPLEAGRTIGLDIVTIRKKIKDGSLEARSYNNKYLIPKAYLLRFMMSEAFLTMHSPSERFNELLEGYSTWKNTI